MYATLMADRAARAAVILGLGLAPGAFPSSEAIAQSTDVHASLQAPERPRSTQEDVRRISLEEAMRLFSQNSLALRIARSDALEVEGAARQLRSYSNPSFTVVREDLSRGADDYWETTIGVEQQMEWPGRTFARSRAARHRIAGASAGYRADSLRLAFEVRKAYAEAWAAEEKAAALALASAAIRIAAEAGERRYEEGDISGYELRRLRVERARIEQAAEVERLQAPEARRALAALVLPEAEVTEVGPAEPLAGRPPALPREDALSALEARPDIVAAGWAVEAAGAEVSAASQAWVPAPLLSLGYKDQADGLSGPALSLAFPLPLFDRGGGARQAAEARRGSATALLELRRREARNDLLASFDRYASARERLETIGDALLGEADELLEIARAAYAEGELTVVELVDAARAFRDARVTAVELRADTWIAYFDLLRAMGRAPEEDR